MSDGRPSGATSALLPPAFALRAQPFRAAGVLADEDVYAVGLLAARYGERDPDRLLALAFAARAPRVGHTGVELIGLRDAVAEERLGAGQAEPLPWPRELGAWAEETCARSPLVGPEEAGRPFVAQPLATGRTLLLTRRLFCEQQAVAAALRARAAAEPALAVAPAALTQALARLYPGAPDEPAAQASRCAAERALCVVTGGPGTGKTFSVTRTLALLLEVLGPDLRLALAAPTGKAAVRMGEAIAAAVGALPAQAEAAGISARLAGLRATTLHRLLGVRPDGSVRARPGATLAADVVVVDEVSMVDLVLMRQLLQALPATGRLILLGDPDQLASVEAGTVLADVVRGAAAPGSPLGPCLVAFQRSRRFAAAPAVAAVAEALQRASGEALAQAERLLLGEAAPAPREDVDPALLRVEWLPWSAEPSGPRAAAALEALYDALAEPYLEALYRPLRAAWRGPGGLRALGQPDQHLRWLAALGRYRVLATHRRGRRGVGGLLAALEARAQAALRGDQPALTPSALPDPARGRAPSLPRAGEHWLGRALLITANDPATGLANGDIGLVLPTPAGALVAAFPDGQGGARAVPLATLPPHSGALAMTVHKSQGSEFEQVALVLHDHDSPIQTRELVYTGITRASRRVRWSGSAEVLARALARPVSRASGLGELLGER